MCTVDLKLNDLREKYLPTKEKRKYNLLDQIQLLYPFCSRKKNENIFGLKKELNWWPLFVSWFLISFIQIDKKNMYIYYI